MPNRTLPIRPNLNQLRRQAKDLLRQIRSGDPAAGEELKRHHVEKIASGGVRLADAQLVLARSYEASSWPRLVLACQLIDAIWRDNVDAVRKLVLQHPQLLNEAALIRKNSNWGPPMTYAANLGRDRIIEVLQELGATDLLWNSRKTECGAEQILTGMAVRAAPFALKSALDRATLQSKIGTARKLHAALGAPRPTTGALDGPAYTLSVAGTALLFELGAEIRDADGKRIAPVDVVLETDSRNPSAKHRILEMYVQNGLELPDTPTMALHRKRVDLLEEHLRRDPGLLGRTFTHQEIYPPEFGCHDEVLATHGTPLAGTTLLHMCIDYDETEIARWLLDRGMQVDAKAAVDADGFGGHTALFATVVSQPSFWMNRSGEPPAAPLTQMLLDHGADPNARASLRKQLHPGYGEDKMHEYRDVTPLAWGERFHGRKFVNAAAMRLIAERGGRS
ncbi:MAG: ankyrin repeat domain-containing protein [Bryobacteraceae bacterium]